MDACVVKQYEWRICILIIHPMILVAKWATSFRFLVAHIQDLVALASGRAVICNPVPRLVHVPFSSLIPTFKEGMPLRKVQYLKDNVLTSIIKLLYFSTYFDLGYIVW